MLFYCLKCRKNIESKNSIVTKTNKEKQILLSKCTLCYSTISRFMNQQEASGLLSSLGIKIPILSKLPIEDLNYLLRTIYEKQRKNSKT